jgi:hypothetical protein
MAELIQAALPWFGIALLPALLLCIAPLLGTLGRRAIAALLLLASVGLTLDVLLNDHSHVDKVEVSNVFPRGEEMHRWVVATVEAPASHWHVFMAVLLAVPGLLLLLRARRVDDPPNPVVHLALVFLFYLVGRLGLEHYGAPAALAWAFGATPALAVMLPFFGIYCGQRGDSFSRFCWLLLPTALLQRLPIVLWGYFATTQEFGTHLDTHVVTHINAPFTERKLEDAFDAWLWPTLVPHLTIWIVITVVAGVALGCLPRWLASRSSMSGVVVMPVSTPRE